MIDFRYHIVSIVSIFLALAVGILLGAGPLQEDLGKTLSSQVATLRQEKADLRAQLNAAGQQVDAGERFAADVTPQLVGSRLMGSSVVLVTLPGSDADTVTALSQVLTAAGASVHGAVRLSADWTDPATTASREQLVPSLTSPTAAAADAGVGLDTRTARLLAGALVVGRAAAAGRATAAATATLAALKQADLVTFDGAGPVLSSLAVVVAPVPDPGVTAQRQAADLAGWMAIAQALDAKGNGAVVVEPTARATGTPTGTGLVAAVRGNGAAQRVVSTVDDASVAVGRVATVYALLEQLAGGVGQYGTGAGASAVLPVLTAGGA